MVSDPAKDAIIRQRVLRSTALNFIGKLIALGTGFLLTPFILHRIGPIGYGLWVLVGSVVGYGLLFDFGIFNAITKFVAEHRARREMDQAHALVATALRLYFALGLVIVVLSVAIAPVFPGLFNMPPQERATATWLLLLMGSGTGISIVCATPLAILLGLQRYDIVNLIGIVSTLLSAAAMIAVLLLGGGVIGMVAANITVTVIMQAPSIWFIHRVAPELQFGWRGARRNLVRRIISFSSPVFMTEVAGRLQSKTDEIVIGAFFTVAAITPCAISLKLSQVRKY